MIINHNMMAINSHRQLGVNSFDKAKSIEKLSSGMRINRAGDDAAGLSISEKMRTQIRGLNQASRNAQDGVSMIQTAEGALNETHDILQRMRELTVQGSNDTNSKEARAAIKDELDQLAQEVDRIAKQTTFNGSKPIGAQNAITINLQVGANGGEKIKIKVTANMGAHDLGLTAAAKTSAVQTVSVAGNQLKVSTHAMASATLKIIDSAIDKVSKLRSKFGAVQNRLEHTIKNINVGAENMTAAESRVRDVDMAKEMMKFTKTNILAQAAQSMLAQANQAPQGVLQLLR